jgi:glycosyltransferase involved in cell wall biosynthesis
MTVLFPFAGDTIGGSHIATISLIKKLRTRGFDTKIILHENGPLAQHLKEEGLEFAFINHRPVRTGAFLPQIVRMFCAGKTLSVWLKENGIKTVHTNDLRMHYTWAIACKGAGCKHIWHQHSFAPSPRLWFYMSFPRHILTISAYAASALPSIYRHKTAVVFNDFDHPILHDRKTSHDSLCAELGISHDSKIAGFVGNLTAQKRPDAFLDIAKAYLAMSDIPATHFVLIGAPRDEMLSVVEQKLKSPQIQDRASFIGMRFPIEPYIAGFDVLIAPSTNEGLGRTPIESMLLGTPVIASDHGGHKEIIEDGKTGFFFAPEDFGSCARILAGILQNPEKTALVAERAREEASRKFTGPEYLEKIIDIYNAD